MVHGQDEIGIKTGKKIQCLQCSLAWSLLDHTDMYFRGARRFCFYWPNLIRGDGIIQFSLAKIDFHVPH